MGAPLLHDSILKNVPVYMETLKMTENDVCISGEG